MEHVEYDLLYKVNSPADLKCLSIEQLPQYCSELRQYIIEECSKNPGHLASSLGTILRQLLDAQTFEIGR